VIEDGRHAYHLIPAVSSKVGAVDAHRRARGYALEDCIAVGDSREDLDTALAVGKFFLVANADPDARSAATAMPNVTVTEAAMGEGFYEAVVRALAEP
jgi:hydroxymethylpyrimidine pyrophosphatase-like HAD family hydrolase